MADYSQLWCRETGRCLMLSRIWKRTSFHSHRKHPGCASGTTARFICVEKTNTPMYNLVTGTWWMRTGKVGQLWLQHGSIEMSLETARHWTNSLLVFFFFFYPWVLWVTAKHFLETEGYTIVIPVDFNDHICRVRNAVKRWFRYLT